MKALGDTISRASPKIGEVHLTNPRDPSQKGEVRSEMFSGGIDISKWVPFRSQNILYHAI